MHTEKDAKNNLLITADAAEADSASAARCAFRDQATNLLQAHLAGNAPFIQAVIIKPANQAELVSAAQHLEKHHLDFLARLPSQGNLEARAKAEGHASVQDYLHANLSDNSALAPIAAWFAQCLEWAKQDLVLPHPHLSRVAQEYSYPTPVMHPDSASFASFGMGVANTVIRFGGKEIIMPAFSYLLAIGADTSRYGTRIIGNALMHRSPSDADAQKILATGCPNEKALVQSMTRAGAERCTAIVFALGG